MATTQELQAIKARLAAGQNVPVVVYQGTNSRVSPQWYFDASVSPTGSPAGGVVYAPSAAWKNIPSGRFSYAGTFYAPPTQDQIRAELGVAPAAHAIPPIPAGGFERKTSTAYLTEAQFQALKTGRYKAYELIKNGLTYYWGALPADPYVPLYSSAAQYNAAIDAQVAADNKSYSTFATVSMIAGTILTMGATGGFGLTGGGGAAADGAAATVPDSVVQTASTSAWDTGAIADTALFDAVPSDSLIIGLNGGDLLGAAAAAGSATDYVSQLKDYATSEAGKKAATALVGQVLGGGAKPAPKPAPRVTSVPPTASYAPVASNSFNPVLLGAMALVAAFAFS